MIRNLAELEAAVRRLEPWSENAERELRALHVAVLRIAESLPDHVRDEITMMLAANHADDTETGA